MKRPKLSNLPACRRFFNCISAVTFMLMGMTLTHAARAQTTTPFVINNNSEYADSQVYVAVVGKTLTTGNHVWINPVTGQVHPMNASYNTVPGPGVSGPYAGCFFKLSAIPGKTFSLPGIMGCRVYISARRPLYFHFFDANGGYTAPDKTNVTDPNHGIAYEYIELTNDAAGFWGNTSRVDAFQYPMGLELYGTNGYYIKVGDLKTRAEAVSLFQQKVPAAFQGCVTDSGQIWAPSKSPDFYDGTASQTVPGVHVNYFKSYVDSIWEKYKNEDLIFYAGQAGTFKGRVYGEQLKCYEKDGGFNGKTGTVAYRPTTQQVLEGKGVLDTAISTSTDTVDRVVQAQLTAAINRHLVNVTTPNVGEQNWYDTSKFYRAAPMNYYAWFWHQPGISVNQLAYGFCYDDVADQSPSIRATPVKVIATFGGYAGMVCDSTAIVPRLAVNGGAMQTATTATLAAGDSIRLALEAADGMWWWTGPNGFSSSARVVNLTNIQPVQAGTYTVVYRNVCGTPGTRTFTITVNGGANTPAGNTCSGAGPNAPGTSTPDYSWQATGTANPVITFTHGTPTAGSTLALLYVKIGSGGYAGYMMDASGTGFTKSITAPAGAQVSIYFTYRVGNTTVERNSSAAPHAFTVGQCGGGGSSNVPPVVSITSPANNAVFTALAALTINAAATDANGSITKVEFYNGPTKIGESTTYPYSYTWTGVQAGTYSLHAVATDNQSATATSAVVPITVSGGNTSGGCSGSGPVAAGQSAPDYSYAITTSGNVNVTFTPGAPISGCDLALFYYRVGAGGWMGYLMSPSSGGFSTSVSIPASTAIQFYFTYRRSAGGPESNTSAAPHSYMVGSSCLGNARMAKPSEATIEELHPNPATEQLFLPSPVESGVVVMDVSAREVPVRLLDARTVDVSSLAPGMYTITFTSGQRSVVKKFVKQ